MKFTFKPNPRFTDELRRDPQFRAFALSKAQQAAQIAESHTPKGFMAGRAGKKPHAESTPEGAALVLEGSGWGLIEFGSANSSPHAPLRKGIEGAGMKFKPR